MTPVVDPQAAFDAETAAHTKATLKRLAASVRRRQEQEVERKDAYRAARKASQQLHAQLTAAVEEDGDDLEYVGHVAAVAREAEAAKELEAASRREWVASVVTRRKAQDELRVAVRRQLTPLPLFDAPQGNGVNRNSDIPHAAQVIERNLETLLEQESEADAAEPPPDPLSRPCPKCRAEPGQKCRDYRGKGKALCPQRDPRSKKYQPPKEQA